MEKERTYICIDLKSFYASVECVELGVDPLTTNLVVADKSRTDKTICLAVSPSLKAIGVPGRGRLFEVNQVVKKVNYERKRNINYKPFQGSSSNANALRENPFLELDYIVATPRMSFYIEYSTNIYNIYLKYIAPEDIHVYSIDEVFIDATSYLNTYQMDAHELAMTMIQDVLKTTGITATAGIGTNMYLAKVAMDIVAKHVDADEDGVRIAQLDEMSYREKLWQHKPLTDFWRIGHGIAARLENMGIYTMGDLARASLGGMFDRLNEDVLFAEFGVNAELLIDHAWGYEPCLMSDIKAYRPKENSLGIGQVLSEPYSFEKGRLIVKEMVEQLSLDLVRKGLVTSGVALTINYDQSSIQPNHTEVLAKDYYGRSVPKHAHGTVKFEVPISSNQEMIQATTDLYNRIVNPIYFVRRINVAAIQVQPEQSAKIEAITQLNLFQNVEEQQKEAKKDREKDKKIQEAVLKIKEKFGKNAALKGFDFEDGATTKERNKQIGGHKA